ncbi:FMN adenylyltransferase / Riboflavin kinase [hydrothermal vent metagenome]|uniref:Bifunctional riboflavin kinase/FMN adenylyltransferase n=1 Tax=hydrothermal vent metagenome TaxID=652676 RepID=A0A3B0U459_9ZZZZ
MGEFWTLRGLNEVPADVKGCVVAIGNFDGLHRGHQSIIRQTLDIAKKSGKKALVLTFEPHPRDLFAPAPFMFRLTNGEQKAKIIEALGMDGIVIMPFDRQLAALDAEQFVTRFLVSALGVSTIVVGQDFHFGKGRAGTPLFLKQSGEKHGFEVVQLSLLESENDPVSSSRIRASLNTGELDHANRLLGYHWMVGGEVVLGDQRGRKLGYPTANFKLDKTCLLAQGVYGVKVRLSQRLFDGVASFGKPMFDIHHCPFEVHIFDFDEDIYGQLIEVALITHIRGQMTFEGLKELIAQMDEDSKKAKKALDEVEPLSPLDKKLGFII